MVESSFLESQRRTMTGDQSRQLKAGDRVGWQASATDLGTVVKTNWAGVTIKWDNRSEQAILHNDMKEIELARMGPGHGSPMLP
jgi:hypothetical protein